MANQIQLIGSFRAEEDVADEAITPGHMLEVTATGVKKHATEGGYAERAVAVEDALQGKIITDAYATAARVFYHLLVKGSVAQFFLKAGETVTKATPLISAGDGTLIAQASATTTTNVLDIIGYPQAALDLTATGAVDTLLAVRVR